MLGDLNIAERRRHRLRGPRVIEQTIARSCPRGSSERVPRRARVSRLVVDRRDMKSAIAKALRFMAPARRDRIGRPAADTTASLPGLNRPCGPAPAGCSHSSTSDQAGLDSIGTLCEASSPERAYATLIVAGTNGKGR